MEVRVFGDQGSQPQQQRDLRQSILRGLSCRCPACNTGGLFRSFARVRDHCDHCQEALHHHRADDLPAYLVILIVGHVVVGAFMGIEAAVTLDMWTHLAIWVPVTILASLAMLPPVKGAVVGLQWALRMHGFGDDPEPRGEDHPELVGHER
jgi:uncharacterized protein (DUF983 family)